MIIWQVFIGFFDHIFRSILHIFYIRLWDQNSKNYQKSKKESIIIFQKMRLVHWCINNALPGFQNLLKFTCFLDYCLKKKLTPGLGLAASVVQPIPTTKKQKTTTTTKNTKNNNNKHIMIWRWGRFFIYVYIYITFTLHLHLHYITFTFTLHLHLSLFILHNFILHNFTWNFCDYLTGFYRFCLIIFNRFCSSFENVHLNLLWLFYRFL